jgi:hypothetical protein
MQDTVRTALGFPLTSDDFTNLYGTFTDEGSVDTVVSILGAIQQTAQKYGDPTTLISELPAFEQAGTPPASIYGHAVWLAAQTQLTAQQILSLLKQGLADIGQDQTAQERLQDLTDLLTGPGGVNSYATTLAGYVKDFQDAVTAFYQELNAELTGQTNSLGWYLGQSTNVYSDAQADVTADDTLISQLTDNINTLNKEYVGFTVAASISPVLILFPIFGPLLAIADAATFGVLASKVKSQLSDLQTQLAGASDDELKKTALVTVLGNFNKSVQDVDADGTAFLNAIGSLNSGWTKFADQINFRLQSLTAEDLENWSAFMQKENWKAAQDGWTLIGSTAETFFDTGVVVFTPASQSWLRAVARKAGSQR